MKKLYFAIPEDKILEIQTDICAGSFARRNIDCEEIACKDCEVGIKRYEINDPTSKCKAEHGGICDKMKSVCEKCIMKENDGICEHYICSVCKFRHETYAQSLNCCITAKQYNHSIG